MKYNMNQLSINDLYGLQEMINKEIITRHELIADEYSVNILAAIDEARDHGYHVYLNGYLAYDENCVEVIHADEDSEAL